MRRLALGLLIACHCSLGCYALDLIDEGQKEMERYSGGSSKAQAESADAADASSEAPPSQEEIRAKLRRWWSDARTLAPGERKVSVVRCEISGGVRFTTAVDCQTSGGRVLGG